MAEYTPTTEEFKHQYLAVYSVFGSMAVDTQEGEFDRWLNQVKAEAWSEGYQQSYRDTVGRIDRGTYVLSENPYRTGK